MNEVDNSINRSARLVAMVKVTTLKDTTTKLRANTTRLWLKGQLRH